MVNYNTNANEDGKSFFILFPWVDARNRCDVPARWRGRQNVRIEFAPKARKAASVGRDSFRQGGRPLASDRQIGDDPTHVARKKWFLDHRSPAVGNKFAQA